MHEPDEFDGVLWGGEVAPEVVLASTLEALDIGAWTWGVTEDEVRWTPAACRLFGRTGAPRSFAGFLLLLVPEDNERVREELVRACSAHAATVTVEYRVVRPDGATRWLESRCAIRYSSDGIVRLISGIVIDITARKA